MGEQALSPFPAGFPSLLAGAVFVRSGEAGWRPTLATAVEWLGAHGYAVLGTEVWLAMDGAIQSLPHFQNIERKSDEGLDSCVARAAGETLAYLRAFNAKSIEEGDLYIM
jgi:hypothetical protein